MTGFEEKKIAVIGLGLMGGSLARALRRRFPSMCLLASSRSENARTSSVDDGTIDRAYSSVDELFKAEDVDLVFVSTPVATIASIVIDIDRNICKPVVVTDVGSTKSEIINRIEAECSPNIVFVGSHPMCGSHEAGYSAAQVDLYEGAYCFVTAVKNTPTDAVELIASLWRSIGVRTVNVAPDFHDSLVSKVSHLPHALAFMLVDYVCSSNSEIGKYVGTGFLDTTRIAQSDADVWTDIFTENQTNLLDDLIFFKSEIDRLIDMLRADDKRTLNSYLKSIANKRKGMDGIK